MKVAKAVRPWGGSILISSREGRNGRESDLVFRLPSLAGILLEEISQEGSPAVLATRDHKDHIDNSFERLVLFCGKKPPA
jgi:hypothetical protein